MGPEPAPQFIEEVLASADPARAERDRQYHKSTRQHWGITMPQLDNVVKRHARLHPPQQLLRLAAEPWTSGIYDLMTAAARKEANCLLDAESSRRLLDFLERKDETSGPH